MLALGNLNFAQARLLCSHQNTTKVFFATSFVNSFFLCWNKIIYGLFFFFALSVQFIFWGALCRARPILQFHGPCTHAVTSERLLDACCQCLVVPMDAVNAWWSWMLLPLGGPRMHVLVRKAPIWDSKGDP